MILLLLIKSLPILDSSTREWTDEDAIHAVKSKSDFMSYNTIVTDRLDLSQMLIGDI